MTMGVEPIHHAIADNLLDLVLTVDGDKEHPVWLISKFYLSLSYILQVLLFVI